MATTDATSTSSTMSTDTSTASSAADDAMTAEEAAGAASFIGSLFGLAATFINEDTKDANAVHAQSSQYNQGPDNGQQANANLGLVLAGKA